MLELYLGMHRPIVRALLSLLLERCNRSTSLGPPCLDPAKLPFQPDGVTDEEREAMKKKSLDPPKPVDMSEEQWADLKRRAMDQLRHMDALGLDLYVTSSGEMFSRKELRQIKELHDRESASK